MTERCVLLLGTPKGAFLLEGDPAAATGGAADRCARAGRSTTSRSSRGTGALLAGGRQPVVRAAAVWRSDDLGETWTHSSEGLTYGDDGPKVDHGLERHGAASTRIYAGVEPAGLFRSTDRGATWAHVEGLTDHPSRPEWGPGAGGLILHTIVPHPTDPTRMWVGISAVGRVRDARRRRDLGRPATRASARTSTRRTVPGVRAVRPQAGHRRGRRASGSTSRTTAASTAPTTAGVAWDGDHRGPAVAVRLRDGRPPARPETVWTIPLTEPEEGRLMPGRRSAAVWRTHDGGATWIRAGEGLPQEDAYVGVLREAMAVDRLDPVGVYFGTSTGQLYGQRRRGPDLVAGSRTTCRRSGPWRRSSLAEAGARPAVVHLPRSLVALFPGCRAAHRGARRDRARGRPGPGPPRARAREPGARRRARRSGRHLNVFVAGERASLDTPVPPGAEVHVDPGGLRRLRAVLAAACVAGRAATGHRAATSPAAEEVRRRIDRARCSSVCRWARSWLDACANRSSRSRRSRSRSSWRSSTSPPPRRSPVGGPSARPGAPGRSGAVSTALAQAGSTRLCRQPVEQPGIECRRAARRPGTPADGRLRQAPGRGSGRRPRGPPPGPAGASRASPAAGSRRPGSPTGAGPPPGRPASAAAQKPRRRVERLRGTRRRCTLSASRDSR